MDIESNFTVPLGRAETWAVLQDIPRIAPCMPGARLTKADDEARSYEGEVQVRLGPVMLTFEGTARIVEMSEDTQSARVVAEGRDKKGRGRANAEVAFSLAEEGPQSTRVEILTNLNLAGSIAQYGRGSGMINDLANHLIGQFAQNLRAEIERSDTPAVTPAGAETAKETQEDDKAQPKVVPEQTAQPSAAPISGFRLMWTLLRSQLRRLFGAR